MIIDFHTHSYEEFIAEKVLEKVMENIDGFVLGHNGRLEGLKKAAKDSGVDIVVQLNIAGSERSEAMINDYAVRSDREAGVYAFGSVYPFSSKRSDELLRLKDAGIRGIKLHPYFQRFIIDDRQAIKFYEDALKMGFILLIHGGNDVSFPGEPNATADRCATVAKHLSGEKLVLAHMGVNDAWEAIPKEIIESDIYLDTSLIDKFDKKVALDTFRAHGIDKILFGSDSPYGYMGETLSYIRSLGLTPKELGRILFENGAELLGLKEPYETL